MAITLRTLIESPVIRHKSSTGWARHPYYNKLQPVHTFWRYIPELDRYLHLTAKDRLKAGARRIGIDTVATHTVDAEGREWLVFEWATGCLALRARTPAEVADVPLKP